MLYIAEVVARKNKKKYPYRTEDELLSFAYEGLIKAVITYRDNYGATLPTYAWRLVQYGLTESVRYGKWFSSMDRKQWSENLLDEFDEIQLPPDYDNTEDVIDNNQKLKLIFEVAERELTPVALKYFKDRYSPPFLNCKEIARKYQVCESTPAQTGIKSLQKIRTALMKIVKEYYN